MTPLTWVTLYQAEPDFHVGQLVPHDPPLTVPDTVRVLSSPRRTLIVELVEADVRRLMPLQAGTSD